MPFTVSHAAAVLPFRRTRLPWSALVIGSFGPDFQYFLRMNYTSRAWHDYPDVLLYCLPFTVFVFFLFHTVIKRPIAGLLPEFVQRRLMLDRDPYPRGLLDTGLLLSALLVGIATHLFWDSFTHRLSFPWRHITALRVQFHAPFLGYVFGYEFAQYCSTVGGLTILGIAFILWYRKTPPKQAVTSRLSIGEKVAIWLIISATSVAVALWRSYSLLGPPRNHAVMTLFTLLFVISVVASFLFLLLAYGLIVSTWQAQKKPGAHR